MNALPEIRAFSALGPTLLHPSDFSAGDASALRHSVALALRAHGRLTLLHIRGADDAGPTRNGLAPIADTLVRWGRLAEAERFADFETRLGFSAACLDMPARSVTSGVLEHLADHIFDLAVLTTRAHSGLTYWLAGSTSRQALRRAHAMTLFLREGHPGFVDPATGEVRLARALVPLDGRIPAGEAVQKVKALFLKLGLDVEMRGLHVGDSPPSDRPKELPLTVTQGPVVETIYKTARDWKADVLVIPTAGKRGLLGAMRSSVSAQILEDARFPVLSVPIAPKPQPGLHPLAKVNNE